MQVLATGRWSKADRKWNMVVALKRAAQRDSKSDGRSRRDNDTRRGSRDSDS